MPVPMDELDKALRKGFPDADISLEDLRGDGDHYSVRIVCASFEGKSRVQQHKMVHTVLRENLSMELHALAIQTATPLKNGQ